MFHFGVQKSSQKGWVLGLLGDVLGIGASPDFMALQVVAARPSRDPALNGFNSSAGHRFGKGGGEGIRTDPLEFKDPLLPVDTFSFGVRLEKETRSAMELRELYRKKDP